MFKKYQHIHFVGIGGSGMSGIAEVLLNLGYRITGSDLKETELTKRLSSLGAEIFFGHKKENINNAHLVVYSSAIKRDNPEIVEANSLKIPTIPRAEMLAELMRLKYSIAVAGCHGKTTTTSMTAFVLSNGGLDPTVVIGGIFNNLGTGARVGQGEYIVCEADESDGSFLKFNPTFAVVTNIDNDHLDFYGSLENVKESFIQFVNKVPFYGCAILCSDNENVRSIFKKISRKYYTYGIDTEADFKAENIVYKDFGSTFDVSFNRKKLGNLKLIVPGKHNILNALASCSIGVELGLDFEKIGEALSKYKGVARRIEIKGEVNDIIFIDDYGHHPTEIKSTLSAVRQLYPERRLFVIFQPHRFTRTKILYKDFRDAFESADVVKITEIYSAGEKEIDGVSSDLIINEIKKNNRRPIGKNASFISMKNISQLIDEIKKGDVVLTLGAGDIWKVADILIEKIRKI